MESIGRFGEVSMKSIVRGILAFIIFSAALLPAQNIAGTWQGTLQATKDTRLILKISKADNGTLKGVLVYIEQNGQSYPVSPVTLEGATFKFSLAETVNYEGKLSADGNAITGTWSNPTNSWPLNFARPTKETAWTIAKPPAPMADDAVFDVSTIKPAKPGSTIRSYGFRGNDPIANNSSLVNLMEWAFVLQAHQIIGAPAWAETEKYDVRGKTEATGQASDHQLKMMLRKLLEERFKLKCHWDKKELPVYELLVGKDGSKLTKSETVGDQHGFGGGPGHRTYTNYAMQNLCDALGRSLLAKPVIDKTGLKDRYDFTLNWTPDEFQYSVMGIPAPPPSDSADAPPGLLTAIQQQLGLKIEQRKDLVDVLVIDHVEKPSEN